MNIEGIKVVNEFTQPHPAFAAFIICAMIAIIAVVAIADHKKYKLYFGIIIAIIVITVIVGVLSCTKFKRSCYSVIITDQAQFEELLENYSIVQQEGLVLTVKENK